MLHALLVQISPEELIATVSTESAYGIKDCLAAIAQRGSVGGDPLRNNGKPWKESRKELQCACAMPRCGLAKG
jgi:hypothetical protein